MQLEGILTPIGRGLALLLLFWLFRNDVNPLLQGPVSLAIAAVANIPAMAFSASIFVLAVLLVIHRLSWPLVDRAAYALQRVHAFRRKKTMALAGFVLLASGISSFGWSPSFAERLSELVSTF